MAKEFSEQTFKETLKALCPIISNLCDMLVAARHAFNRHSVKELEGLAALQKAVTLEIDPFFEKVEMALKDKRQADQPVLPRLQGVLTHLEIIGSQIGGIADPIRMKTKGGALFSDEDVIFINNLFSKLTGLLRTLADVFTYQDPLLKKYMKRKYPYTRSFQRTVSNQDETVHNDGRKAGKKLIIHKGIVEKKTGKKPLIQAPE